MDKVVEKVVALGIPGLVLLVAIATSGLAGGAAIVAALATLGGPFGILGGLAMLGILTLISNALAKYGFERLFKAVVDGLQREGYSKDEIRRKIRSYPISKALKDKILSNL